MPGKADVRTSAISGNGMQPRFVRSNLGLSGAPDKPRFISRHRPASTATRLQRCLTGPLAFRLRRSKRVTAALLVGILALALGAAVATVLRLVYPRSLSRFTASVEDVKAGVLDFTNQYAESLGGLAGTGGAAVNASTAVSAQLEMHLSENGAHPVAVDAADNSKPEGGGEAAVPPRAAGETDLLAPVGNNAVRGDGAHGSVDAAAVLQDIGSLADNDVRKTHAAAKMSIVVLFHNEYDSLKGTLRSWIDKGLIDYADEFLFFLNGVRSEAVFKEKIPDFEKEIAVGKRNLFLSPENLPLGKAILKMVELARHDIILLLEKDWELIEEKSVMRSRLDDSKVLVGTGVADVVRHRHRHNPGVPLHALIMHDGREEAILRIQKNLLCYVHHWQKDPTVMFPGAGIMRRCGGPENNVEEKDVYCSSSEYCQWTNNPGVFKKRWFIDEVGERFKKEYDLEFAKHGKSSPFLDFEYYTNWRRYAWTEKNFTVAVGTGLFRHAETEHRHFNTFWYAHYRLTVDQEEIRTMYLKNETAFKRQGGVHRDPASPIPPTMMERYPVEFVRKYHWKDMFTGTIETQRKLINDRYKVYLDRYRILTQAEWDTTGPKSPKATKHVDWRAGITGLHFAVEQAMMIAPPKQPHEMNITLITCLLDLGRDELATDAYQFKREFKMYLDALADWLRHKYPKVVYTSKQIMDEVMKTMDDEAKASTKFVLTSRQELRTKWLGYDNYERVQEIRKSKEWRARASWLANSPQAALQDYNPLVMSKLFMVRDAARKNYFDTSHFVFIDSKHNCRRPKIMTPRNDHILRAHMFNKFLLTTFDYTPASEVHGFEYSAFNKYLNIRDPKRRQNVQVGRGGIFGGSAFVIEYIAAMYDVALTATLREGLMGTEENILSILKYQVKQYVDDFSNNWACPDNLKGNHKCSHLKHQGYNCAIFDWVSRNAVEWSAVPHSAVETHDLLSEGS